MFTFSIKYRELSWLVRIYLGKFNFLFPFYFYFYNYKWFKSIYEKNPEIVIEGYGGSGNSFAVYAFEAAQDKKISIAHHLHITAQIKKAVKHKKPVILLLRNPVEAGISLLSRDYIPSAKTALRIYILFYKDLIRYKKYVEIAKFDDVTKDFNKIIENINAKYHCNYSFDSNIGKKALVKLNSVNKPDTKKGLPNEERVRLKELARIEFEKLVGTDLYNESYHVYNYFINNNK